MSFVFVAVQAAGSTPAAEQVIYVYKRLWKVLHSHPPSSGVGIHRSPALLRVCFQLLARTGTSEGVNSNSPPGNTAHVPMW